MAPGDGAKTGPDTGMDPLLRHTDCFSPGQEKACESGLQGKNDPNPNPSPHLLQQALTLLEAVHVALQRLVLLAQRGQRALRRAHRLQPDQLKP